MLLSDVDLLVGTNTNVAQAEHKRARHDMSRVHPVLEKMKATRETLEESLESVEENGTSRSRLRTKEVLVDVVGRVGQGQAWRGCPFRVSSLISWSSRDLESRARSSPRASGFFGLSAVKLAEDEARVAATDAVNKLAQLSDKRLRALSAPSASSCPRRCSPFVMTRRATAARARHPARSLPAGCTACVSALPQRPDMLDTVFFDIFDVRHQFWLHFCDDKGEHGEEVAVSTLRFASIGTGAPTMAGGKAMGARSLLEGAARICDLPENETARKWAAVICFAPELPSTIPKTVGRWIKASLAREGEEKGEEGSFVGANVEIRWCS